MSVIRAETQVEAGRGRPGQPLPETLVSSLRRAGEGAPFWRGKVRGLAGLPFDTEPYEEMPLLERADLMSRPASDLASCGQSEIFGHFLTSGTTNASLSVPYSKELMAALSVHLRETYRMLGLDATSLVALGYGNANGAAFAMHAFALRQAGVDFLHLSESDRHEAHARLANEGATDVFAPAGYVLGLCEVERSAARRELSRLRTVLCSGMPLSDSGRGFVEETLGVEAFRCAGATEVSLLACECQQKSGMHLFEDLVFAEFLLTGGSQPWPTMVVSSMRNPAFHLFRYHLGDVVAVHEERCACGSSTPRIEILGRENDFVVLPKGEPLRAVALQSVVNGIHGLTGGFRLVSHTGREPMVVECEAEAWCSDGKARAETAESLRDGILRCLEVSGGSPDYADCISTVIRLVEPGALSAEQPKYRRMVCVQ